MKNNIIRFVQISDIHLFADKERALLGVKTYDSFSELIKLLKSDPNPPQFIILSGDLSQDDSKESYQHLTEILQTFSLPIYFIPGNHDNDLLMTKTIASKNISTLKNIVFDQWQIILLNSQEHGAVPGFLDESQFQFLQECLEAHPEHYAIVVFHHHPIPIGTSWLDPLGLKNADELWTFLKSYPKVHTVLFGHVHQEINGEKNGIHYYSVPSTCIQFKKNTHEFKLDKVGPGYRWIDLYPNGELKTGIIRLDHYVGNFDINAKGY